MFSSNENTDYPLNGVEYVVHDRKDFEWPLNKVTINLERTGENDFYVYLDTITPNFKGFEIYDGKSIYISEHKHKLINIATRISIRSINKFGMYGPFSDLSLAPSM